MRPILLPLGPGPDSTNHRLPSGPLAMSLGRLLAVGIGNSLKVAAKARPAPLPAAHSKAIVASSKRRYLFCMCFPPGSQHEKTKYPTLKYDISQRSGIPELASTRAGAEPSQWPGRPLYPPADLYAPVTTNV